MSNDLRDRSPGMKPVGIASQSQVSFAGENNLANALIPCAVCFVPDKVVFENSGSAKCPEGYDVEYDGYLMSAHKNSERTDAICVDRLMTPYTSADASRGAHIYPIEIRVRSGDSLTSRRECPFTHDTRFRST